jgi:hypothetical protein
VLSGSEYAALAGHELFFVMECEAGAFDEGTG